MFHKLSSSMFLCFITLWISPRLIHSSMSQGGMKSPFIKGISISINFYELWYDCNMWGLQPHSNLTKSATLLSCVLPPLLWLKLCRVFFPFLNLISQRHYHCSWGAWPEEWVCLGAVWHQLSWTQGLAASHSSHPCNKQHHPPILLLS